MTTASMPTTAHELTLASMKVLRSGGYRMGACRNRSTVVARNLLALIEFPSLLVAKLVKYLQNLFGLRNS